MWFGIAHEGRPFGAREDRYLPVPSPALFAPAKPRIHLLVWDAPNMDMTLAGILGRRPTSDTRPRYDSVARWFLAEAGEDQVEAAVFTNYAEGTASTIRPWIEAVRKIGYNVFVKPKIQADDDIDDAMVEHIRATRRLHELVRLVVVSADGKNFQELLERLAGEGVEAVVVAFNEVASWARLAPGVHFVDLEDIPGAFKEPLNRIRLEDLPAGGAWLPATGDLRANFVVTSELTHS